MLPKLNGREVLQEIRKDNRHVPVLMLTVRSEFKDKDELFRFGADDYLTKPFLFDELLLHIRALLKRPAKAEGEFYKVDNLTLNMRTKIIRRGSKEIYLTRRVRLTGIPDDQSQQNSLAQSDFRACLGL